MKKAAILLMAVLGLGVTAKAFGIQLPYVPAATYILIGGTLNGPTVTYTANASLYAAAYNANGGFIEGAAAGSAAVAQDGANRMFAALHDFESRDPWFFVEIMNKYGLQFNEPSGK